MHLIIKKTSPLTLMSRLQGSYSLILSLDILSQYGSNGSWRLVHHSYITIYVLTHWLLVIIPQYCFCVFRDGWGERDTHTHRVGVVPCTHTEDRRQHWALFFRQCLLWKGPLTGLEFTSHTGSPESLQELACHCRPSAGIASAHHYAWSFCAAYGDQTRIFEFAKQMLYQQSHLLTS